MRSQSGTGTVRISRILDKNSLNNRVSNCGRRKQLLGLIDARLNCKEFPTAHTTTGTQDI
jgi:hypothetical protein